MEYGYIVYGPENNSSVLTIFTLTLSTIGISLSIVALLLIFLTAILFQEWKKVYKNKLLIQFMTARFVFTIVRYICDIINAFEYGTTGNSIVVYIFLMIYTEMALVTWTYVFSKHMYDSFVKMCNVENLSLWKVSLTAWIVPAFICLILYCLYNFPMGKDFYFLPVYLVFIKWPILCVNGVQLALTLKYIININQSKTKHNFRIVVLMIILIFTFSIQHALWDIHNFFCVVIYNKYERVPFFFTVTNIFAMYQCGFTILFWLFGNTNTRKLWKFESLPNGNSRTTSTQR